MKERIKLPSDVALADDAALEFYKGAWWIVATNQGGYDSTRVSLPALLRWLRANRPDLLKAP